VQLALKLLDECSKSQPSTIGARPNPFLMFATNVRKSNHSRPITMNDTNHAWMRDVYLTTLFTYFEES
jgi:hypothetical protein